MRPLLSIVPLLLAAASLGGVYLQGRRIVVLEKRVAAAETRAPASDAEEAPGPSVAEVGLLRARLDVLERTAATRPAAAGGAPGAVAPAAPQIDQLRADVDALLTGEATGTEQGKARLRALLEEAQREQSVERETRRQQQVLDRLTQAAHLSDRQREDLGKAMETERTQRRATMESARSGQMNFEQLRPLLEALRAETDKRAKELLDSDQYAAYEASRSQGRGPRSGAGAPGSAPGPGRAGGERRAWR